MVALETALARVQWPAVESRDPLRTNNAFTIEDLAARMPGFDWFAWARPQGISPTTTVVIAQPDFFVVFATLVPATPLETWKAWLAARHITNAAPFLNKAFADARFDFFGRLLVGQEAPRTRWRRGVSLVNTYLGEAIGRLYVERHFPATARSRMQSLVGNLLDAYRTSIAGIDWMTDATKRQALDKLSRLSMKIGAPARWRDYRRLIIRPDDLIGNIQRAQRFENNYRLTWLTQPSNRTQWLVTPQTINAYYHPAINEVVFPAAILQPPFFEPTADDAVNYGAIGAVIGHEIGHAFDDRGRRFDSAGTIRDWWTPGDDQEFRRRVQGLVDHYNRYSALPGVRVNGFADARRKHRRSRGTSGRVPRVLDVPRRQARSRHRRPDRRSAFLHGLGAGLAVEGPRRVPAPDGAHQPAPAQRVPRQRTAEPHRRVLRGVRREARGQVVCGTCAPREDLVRREARLKGSGPEGSGPPRLKV